MKLFGFFQTAETRKRAPNSGVKGSGANHYPRAPTLSSNNGAGLLSSVLLLYCFSLVNTNITYNANVLNATITCNNLSVLKFLFLSLVYHMVLYVVHIYFKNVTTVTAVSYYEF